MSDRYVSDYVKDFARLSEEKVREFKKEEESKYPPNGAWEFVNSVSGHPAIYTLFLVTGCVIAQLYLHGPTLENWIDPVLIVGASFFVPLGLADHFKRPPARWLMMPVEALLEDSDRGKLGVNHERAGFMLELLVRHESGFQYPFASILWVSLQDARAPDSRFRRAVSACRVHPEMEIEKVRAR